MCLQLIHVVMFKIYHVMVCTWSCYVLLCASTERVTLKVSHFLHDGKSESNSLTSSDYTQLGLSSIRFRLKTMPSRVQTVPTKTAI